VHKILAIKELGKRSGCRTPAQLAGIGSEIAWVVGFRSPGAATLVGLRPAYGEARCPGFSAHVGAEASAREGRSPQSPSLVSTACRGTHRSKWERQRHPWRLSTQLGVFTVSGPWPILDQTAPLFFVGPIQGAPFGAERAPCDAQELARLYLVALDMAQDHVEDYVIDRPTYLPINLRFPGS